MVKSLDQSLYIYLTDLHHGNFQQHIVFNFVK